MFTEQKKRQVIDEKYIRLLVILHYVYGGIIAFFTFFVVSSLLFFGSLMSLFHKHVMEDSDRCSQFAISFTKLSGVHLIVLGIYALLLILIGHFLIRKKNYLFVLIATLINLFSAPYYMLKIYLLQIAAKINNPGILVLGSVLAVFTLIVLLRPSVKRLFFDLKS